MGEAVYRTPTLPGRAGVVLSSRPVNDLFLRTCRGEATERRPVWIMRQAGRYLPEYRAIRQKVGFLDLCKDTDLAAEVSLQPYRIVGVDAVIFFSDILIPVEAMGLGVELTDKGPELANPIRSQADVDKLRKIPATIVQGRYDMVCPIVSADATSLITTTRRRTPRGS